MRIVSLRDISLLFNYHRFFVVLPAQALPTAVAVGHKFPLHGNTTTGTDVVIYGSVFSQLSDRHRCPAAEVLGGWLFSTYV